MARRRTLEAPSAEELRKIEEGFARETSSDFLGLKAPIAHVAGETAALSPTEPADIRAKRERDHADSVRLKEAQEKGLLVLEIPLPEIGTTELSRDRVMIDEEEMDELQKSIEDHGLRLPIEVFELDEAKGHTRYGLISGFRRLAAVQRLYDKTGDRKYTTIRALLQKPNGVVDAYVAMVEENEIRADLSQYERGRIAVIAKGQGAFKTVEAAVNKLYPASSKAKRSKIRSFALVHEELGDLLKFPSALSERAGLRLAGALKAGYSTVMRDLLADSNPKTFEKEFKVVEPIIKMAEEEERDPSKGGRPLRNQTEKYLRSSSEEKLADGVAMLVIEEKGGFKIELKGDRAKDVSKERVASTLRNLYC
jgi:ParB family transcriptional regulator, chromosome partitioning protein